MDFGANVECNNCGARAAYLPASEADRKRGKGKSLPMGWLELPNTIAGTAHFDSKNCQDGWTGSREWYRGPSTIEGVQAPEPPAPEEPLLAPQPAVAALRDGP